MRQNDRYTLATGEVGANRLQILHQIHKPYTEFLLRRVGLSEGMHIADIGCGIGSVSTWLGEQVGFNGSVIGVDVSTEQVEQARGNADALGLSNVKFVLGSAYNTELPHNSFDLVYCRFLLIHLTRPKDALEQMLALLKPNGLLVCEEADFSTAFCQPANSSYDRCIELFLRLGNTRGQHFCMGSKLYQIFQNTGLLTREIFLVQPVAVHKETKRFIDLSLKEATDALIETGITTPEEIKQTIEQIRELAEDETTLFGIPRVTQIWARK
ncbi:MAG: methyltransferase domain-containing protein [Rhizonema sp. NSF051]|nr:methyltransferase domain-containing protein [Rhizonema sp. NSF051]